MKQYLIRGGADPLCEYTPMDVIATNYIGGNSGNLLFLYGVINALTTNDSVCIPTYYKQNWTDKEIDEINEEYSAFVLPLADAFRQDFVPSLRMYTELLKKIKIPCIVIGVGLRDKYEPELKQKKPFDEDVKCFVKEVLNHSAQIGLRGEFTAEYLKRLGFLQDSDYTVIGCPSLYMHGSHPKIKSASCHTIGVNLNAIAPEYIKEYYIELLKKNNNIHIIQQRRVEFIDWYYGISKDLSSYSKEFPKDNVFERFDYNKMKKEGRVHFFLNLPSWFKFSDSLGVFVGCRFHGIAAALLSGVPSIITPIDSRTRELALHHHIPQIKEEDVKKKIPFMDVVESMDFSPFYEAHEKNMNNYIRFLKNNGLETIFQEGMEYPFGTSVLEKKIISRNDDLLEGYLSSGIVTRINRKAQYYSYKAGKTIKRW